MIKDVYGYELILDLQGCDVSRFNRLDIDDFFTELCQLIDMEKCDVHFWDDEGVPDIDKQTSPHTKGTSAVCFILTSSIVVHTLDLLESVFINVFSCKTFTPETALEFAEDWFDARDSEWSFIERFM